GHALGLTRPNSGHTTLMSGFRLEADGSDLNVMGAWSDISARYLSVGQVLQMHMKGDSWLNLPSAPGGSTLRQRLLGAMPVVDVCGCPETQRTDYCPALSFDIARSGTLSSAPTSPQVCFMTSSAVITPVACTADTPVMVWYYQGAFPTLMIPAR